MLNVNEKEAIRRAVLVEGKSQRAVARETGYSRNTIRKMLTDGDVPKYKKREARKAPVLGDYKELLDKWVAEDEGKPKKLRRTARRMYQILKEEHGYSGSEPTLRIYVGQARKKSRQKLYVPLAYEPAEVAQVDFGETPVIIDGKQVTAHLLIMWWGYSGATFVQAYPAETQEVFFAGHVAGFEFFGGVPREIWYDNLKIAVAKVLKGRGRQEQEAFVSFRSHYLFKAEFCNVAAGWEKGGVEGRVGYTRRNWLIPMMELPSWIALNAYLQAKCEQELARKMRGRKETIGDMFQREREHALPLPTYPHPCCKIRPTQANHLSLVTYASNRYSVPTDHAHEALWIYVYADRIDVANKSEVIATHARCWDREQDILDPLHYLGLLAQKPRAFSQAKPIREWQQQWPMIFQAYWAAMKDHLSEDSTPIFIKILQLCLEFDQTIVAEGLRQALDCHCYSLDGVRALVRRVATPSAPEPLDVTHHPEWQIQSAVPDVQQFNQLLQTGGQS
mgnify:CR=1 FL=1